MDRMSEQKLIGSLTWCDKSYTLAEFLRQYSLPQLIRVVQGYHGGTENTSLSHGDVLVLHATKSTRIFAAEDSQGHVVTIAADCPHKLQVLPDLGDFKSSYCKIEDLSVLFPIARYIQVVRGNQNAEHKGETLWQGQCFEILKVGKKPTVKDTSNGHTLTLTSKCGALFTPLLDWRSHLIGDVKHLFGLPTRVRFPHMKDEANTAAEKVVTGDADVTLIQEEEEIVVMATTVGETTESRFCYEIPANLQVKVTVAKDDASYGEIVSKLDQRFNLRNFPNVQPMRSFKRKDSIVEYTYDSIKNLFSGVPSQDAGKTVEETTLDLGFGSSIAKLHTSPPLPPKNVRGTSLIRRSPAKSMNKEDARSFPNTGDHSPSFGSSFRKPRSLSEPVDPQGISKKAPRVKPPVPERVCSIKKPVSHSVSDPQKHTANRVNPVSSCSVPRTPKLPYDVAQTGLTSFQKHVTEEATEKPQAEREDVTRSFKGAQPENAPEDPKLPQDVVSHLVRGEGCATRQDARQSLHVPSVPSDPLTPSDSAGRESTTQPQDECVSEPSGESGTSQVTLPELLPRIPIQQPLAEKILEGPGDDGYLAPNEMYHTQSAGTAGVSSRAQRHCAEKRYSEESGNDSEDVPVYETVDFPELERELKAESYSVPRKCVSDTEPCVDDSGCHENLRAEKEGHYAHISLIPHDLSGLSVRAVAHVLRSLNLGCYVETFEQEMIDGSLLKKLEKDDLESLNMSPFHATKLMEFINGWRPTQ